MTYRPCRQPSEGPAPRIYEINAELRRRDPAGAWWGSYNRRRIRGSRTRWSVHACGRATDWHPSSRAKGDELLAWLTGPEGPADIQLVIWWGRVWRRTSAPWMHAEDYRGADPHRTHLHIETSDWDAHNRLF